MLGDVVGQAGCDGVRSTLPALKKRYGAELVVVNGENSAEGNGVLPHSAKHLFDSGADVVTTGNHALKRREIYPVLEEKNGLLRPVNFHPEAPGAGVFLVDRLRYKIAVVNLMGKVGLEVHENPFDAIDRVLQTLDTPFVLVDFHAEATSEKLAMGYYLDGRVSAVVGTHTHVQTADERVLPGGSAYLTDLGMCGGENSVLGVKPEEAIHRLRTGLPTRFENAGEPVYLWGAAIEVDEATGRAKSIERVCCRARPAR